MSPQTVPTEPAAHAPDTLTPVVTDLWDKERSWSLATYRAYGGYQGLARAKAMNLLVGPMRPLVVGGEYDPSFHTFETLGAAALGVSCEGLTLEGRANFRPRLVPMDHRKDDDGRPQQVHVARKPRR